MKNLLSKKDVEIIQTNKQVRIELARKSFLWFCAIYLNNHFTHPFAKFHEEIMSMIEDEDLKLSVVTAFRGSGKTTLVGLAYPIWSIIGKQNKKLVLILCQTQFQARQALRNIKFELESNDLLKNDIGPFEEESDEWSNTSLILTKFGAKITIASVDQSVRGLKHSNSRPGLVICDDVEDLNSVRTFEAREKTYEWLTSTIMPIGDEKTKYFVIGNLLHEDCLIKRLEKHIDKGENFGKYRSYPIIDDEKKILWVERYPDLESIEKIKRMIPSDLSWNQEFLLKTISRNSQIIEMSWLNYYDELPSKIRKIFVSVDPAFSEKKSAAKTAITIGFISGYGQDSKLFIHKVVFNKRCKEPDLIKEIEEIHSSLSVIAPVEILV